MVRCWRGGNRAAPPPRSASSQRHCVQAPCLGFELLGTLLDRCSFVRCLDGAEQGGLGGDLVDVPACRLRRFWLAWHAGSIGQAALHIQHPPVVNPRPPPCPRPWAGYAPSFSSALRAPSFPPPPPLPPRHYHNPHPPLPTTT